MSIYKRYSGKSKCMYFMIKDKYMTIWEEVSNIIKKTFNSELIFNKKYLKAKKRFNTKESFQCFYIPVILFDSVYRKDGIYYPKVFLEKFIHNFFLEKYKKFWFSGLWKCLRKYKEFFRGFRFLKYKKSFLLIKYKKCFRCFRFQKTKEFSQGEFFLFSRA